MKIITPKEYHTFNIFNTDITKLIDYINMDFGINIQYQEIIYLKMLL
jgi:hypothetical protein